MILTMILTIFSDEEVLVLHICITQMCREELRAFDRALFDSLERVANVSLEGDVCKQAGFQVSFGGLGCRRKGDIALSSVHASVNSVNELVETFLSITTIADTNDSAEDVEFCWWGGGGAGLVVVLPWTSTLLRRSKLLRYGNNNKLHFLYGRK